MHPNERLVSLALVVPMKLYQAAHSRHKRGSLRIGLMQLHSKRFLYMMMYEVVNRQTIRELHHQILALIVPSCTVPLPFAPHEVSLGQPSNLSRIAK